MRYSLDIVVSNGIELCGLLSVHGTASALGFLSVIATRRPLHLPPEHLRCAFMQLLFQLVERHHALGGHELSHGQIADAGVLLYVFGG